MFDVNYSGARWGYTFCMTDSRIPEYDRMNLVFEAIDMHLDGQKERNVRTDTLEGKITTDGKHYSIGAFCGKEYKAIIESPFGKTEVSFLITERIDPSLN